MKTFINKDNLVKVMSEEGGDQGVRSTAGILLALVEIREAIVEGCERIDQTNIEAALMLVGCKETLDAFLQRRLESEEVLTKMTEDIGRLQSEAEKMDEVVKTLGDGFASGKIPEYDDKPESPPPEEKKSAGVLNEESFGPIPFGSGKT